MKTPKLKNFIAVSSGLLFKANLALAQSSEWVRPASDLVDNLNSGLVKLGIPVLGVAIIGTGLAMAFAEQPNVRRIVTIVVAGVLITAGPTILNAFLGN